MRMKGTKFLASIIMAVAMLTIVFGQTISYAEDTVLYIGVSEAKESGTAYAIGSIPGGKHIRDLVSYVDDSTNANRTNPQKNLYCAKGGVGFGDTSAKVIYNQSYNLRTQKSAIEGLSSRSTNYSDIAGTYYNQILIVLDNIYVPGVSTESEKTALFKAAGIYSDDGTYANPLYGDFPLTNDDIETVQQMVIWHYTNAGDVEYGDYSQNNLQQLNIKKSDMSEYENLASFNQGVGEGATKAQQMELLFSYLIDTADANASSYNPQEEGAPITISGTLSIQESGTNYKVGPITITENNDLLYTLDTVVKDGSGSTISSDDYSFIDSSNNTIDINTATGDVYLLIPQSKGNSLSIEFTTNYSTTDATYWISGTNVDQPILEIVKTAYNPNFTLSTNPEHPFDLSLRKFISAKNGVTLPTTESREPVLGGWTVDSGTTIKKDHTKELYDVKENDLVEFTIRVYNEGEVAGYAQEITDYILNNKGLEFVPAGSGAGQSETNETYGWKMYKADGTEASSVEEAKYLKTDYLSKGKEGTPGANLLKAFDKTKEISNSGSDKNPDYRDIKIEFKVVYPKNNGELDRRNKTFVNIAAITDDADESGNAIEDRDSTPRPEDTNYPNPTYNTETHEDDIDYEPVHLLRFDLALKKYIAAVSHDPIIENGEYITNTGNKDGVYTRAPKVTAITNYTVTYQEHNKTPEAVKSGDFVLYTFRIYNEGQTDGYARLIRDSIPEGLKFATSDDVNTPEEAEAINNINAIWTYLPKEGLDPNIVSQETYEKFHGWEDNSNDTIMTDILAKGQGEELGSVAGDDNYTANLLKALKTDESGNGTVSETSPLNPDYREVQVLFKVIEPDTSTRVLVNKAQISDDTDENGEPVTDDDSIPDEWNEGEDDQDIEKVELETMDLALRKYITKVGSTEIENREPSIDTKTLVDETTATYNHKKDPVEVKKGDLVTFKITAYNEGTVDGYASEITDYLPEGLEFVDKEYQLQNNTTYSWTMYKADGTETTDVSEARIIKTDALKNVKLEKRTTNTGNTEIPYILNSYSVEVQCRVKNSVEGDDILTNIAEISEYRFKGNSDEDIVNPDRDSTSNNVNVPEDTDLPDYKGHSDNKPELNDSEYFYKGQQDDDDFEKVKIEPDKYDLALRKFIASVEGKTPQIPSTNYWRTDEASTLIKNHSKAAVKVATGDKIVFTIRVYNEGNVDGKALEVTDFLPAGLEYIPAGTEEGQSSINQNNGWTMYKADGTATENAQEAKILKTTKLSTETIKAFNSNSAISTTEGSLNPDYRDLQIECKVVATKIENNNLRNIAAITNDDGEDIDSSPSENPDNGDYNPTSPETGKGEEDDDDFELLDLKKFDLALRKYVTSIEGKAQDREPQVDVTPLKNGENTAIYKHAKAPLPVNKGNKIIYTLRVYNEGDIDGYASKITDYIPEGLEFVTDSEINRTYQWTEVEGSNGRKYETEYLSGPRVSIPENPAPDYSNFIIKAFDGTTLDSKFVQIELKVKDTVQVKDKLTNIAEISEYRDEEYNVINPDRDSKSESLTDGDSSTGTLPSDTDLPGYKDTEIERGDEYIPGQEDDDDFEKVYIPQFDLALRKYITNIAGKEEESRIPEVSYEDGKIEYKHSKSPLQVVVGDVVVYTIRAYNEGETAGYAAEIADNLPEYLTFLPDNSVNKEYQWKMYDKDGNVTEDVSKATQIKTTYLSKENEKTPGANLIKAFDSSKAISDTNPDHRDVKIAFQVNNNAPAQTVITNLAQITDDTDENGNPVEDTDSTPNEWNDGEDDQDLENVIPQQFDLSLIKYVSQVIVTEDGKTTTTETKNTGNNETDIIPKVEIHRKKLNSTTVKFVYTIKITNEGDIAGYAKEITDYVPEGLAFHSEDNTGWTVKEDGVIATRNLEDKLLQPGESADVKVTFRWINGANNLNLKRNTAEISEDYNEKEVPDRDSTPNNKIEGEDDIDIADVLLSIKTGKAATYVLLVGAVLVVLAGGIIFIKKYAM